MKNKIITFSFISFILVFSILHIVILDESISSVERRKLKTFPKFELSSDYINEIDEYLLDHFPFRNLFRSIKANFNYKVLNKLDNNNIYLKDDYIFKSNYPTDKKSINYFVNNINKINGILSEDNNVYMMIIPDKNYYIDEDLFLNIDYNYLYDKINKLDVNKIDIRDIMNINDYYKTDTHWVQQNLDKVVVRLNEYMNFNYKKIDYKINTYDKFYGVYYGEASIYKDSEELSYLTNDIIDNVSIKYLENDSLDKVYNTHKLHSLDSYEVFLDGASSYIEINNDNSTTDKELVIFRDSFGSSISPLLIPYYKKITIVDNRYINSNNFLEYISFNNQDVLFIYSTLVVNNSYSLKG